MLSNSLKRKNTLKTLDYELTNKLSKYIMTEFDLKLYGFPLTDPLNVSSALFEKELFQMNSNSRVRNCSRCKKTYTVDDYEMPVTKADCHWHRRGLWNGQYVCCRKNNGSRGCNSNDYHVIDAYDRHNYVQTLPLNPMTESGYHGIYGLDCEMVFN